RRITINLAPANLPKYGTHLDLAMAISLLKASGQIKTNFAKNHYALGELSLMGQFKFSPQCFNLILGALQQNSLNKFIFPYSLSIKMTDVSVSAILLKNLACLKNINYQKHSSKRNDEQIFSKDIDLDIFSDIIGQYSARRALQISLAGHHHLLLVGPPGCGKSLIADKLKLLPNLLDKQESWQSKRLFHMTNYETEINSAGIPVRCPHHSASIKGILGGGRPIMPGEVSLSHRGYLILDELPEFKRNVLESLRQIMQNYKVHLSHGFEKSIFPAVSTVLATMNPCPCGYYNSSISGAICRCTPQQIHNYQSRISGPLLDRFGMSISLQLDDNFHLRKECPFNLKEYWESILKARKLQINRYEKNYNSNTTFSTYFNGQISEQDFQKFSGILPGKFKKLSSLKISNRKHSQLLRIAQTIADLEESHVTQEHFDEAIYLQQFVQFSYHSERKR
ncbi:MAG: ATP-binding protein, partial [bacterium]|nr:ATP-binding protein [bacterium]